MPQVEVVDATDLVHNTLFLSLSFGSMGNSRKVKEDVLNTEADHEYIKVSKTLLDSKELKAITKADSAVRMWLKNVCLPFEKGLPLVPYGLVDAVTTKLKSYESERKVLVADFVTAYPQLREQARENLGPLYNSKDYPDPEYISNAFAFKWHFMSVGAPGELRTISEKLFLEEQERQAEQFKVASEEITNLMRQTMLDMVTRLQDKLTDTEDGKQKRLHATAVTGLQEFLDGFSLRNVTNDTQLAEQVRKAQELLAGTSAATLRSSDEFRERIRSGMEGITSTLSTMVVEPGRKFREEGDE